MIPSQSESFGLAALEAMACSLPVIGTSVGGLPELIVHGETGYISEIGDLDRMARYIIDLLSDSSKYKMFAAASRERAVKNFNIDKIVSQYEEFYRKILSE